MDWMNLISLFKKPQGQTLPLNAAQSGVNTATGFNEPAPLEQGANEAIKGAQDGFGLESLFTNYLSNQKIGKTGLTLGHLGSLYKFFTTGTL